MLRCIRDSKLHGKFFYTCSFYQIQRVQCPRVYERYQVEKAKMGLIFHATNIAVDKTLYHGAESKCMDQIIAYGFDLTECAGKDGMYPHVYSDF